jgi:hypothetical protein
MWLQMSVRARAKVWGACMCKGNFNDWCIPGDGPGPKAHIEDVKNTSVHTKGAVNARDSGGPKHTYLNATSICRHCGRYL